MAASEGLPILPERAAPDQERSHDETAWAAAEASRAVPPAATHTLSRYDPRALLRCCDPRVLPPLRP
eukprot:4740865-Prymnesium_polylepis.1